MLVHEFLEQSADRFPDKTAVVSGEDRISYGDLNAAGRTVSDQLETVGLNRGDRVAMLMPNCLEAVVAIFAIMKAGGTVVVMNPTMKPSKVRFILNDCGATCFVTSLTRIDVLEQSVNDTPDLRNVVLAHGGADELSLEGKAVMDMEFGKQSSGIRADERASVRMVDADLAALIYTSGSTAEPKGVMLTHLNMVSAAESITEYLELTSKDVVLNVLPLSFDYGLYQVLMTVKVGATLILEASFAYPGEIVRHITEERVTVLPVVPTMLAILLQLDLDARDLSSLRCVTSTGAVLPERHIRKLRQIAPDTEIYSMYGLTECKRVSYLHPDEIDRRPDSVGKPMPNVEVYVVDELGNRVGPDTVGQLVVRGTNVMVGYWGRDQETDRVLRPGPVPGERVLFTGDLFRMDSDGYLYFVGRMDDIIKSRGEKVSPREIESVVCSLEGVLEAAVVGVADDTLGQAIKAVVTVEKKSRLDERAVLRHCARHLENFMVPQRVEIRDELPRTPSGKIDKRALAEG